MHSWWTRVEEMCGIWVLETCGMTGCGHSPVTADVRKMGARLSEFMLRAHSSTSSMLRTRKGFFFTPGFFRMVMRFCSTGGEGRGEGARVREGYQRSVMTLCTFTPARSA